MTPLMKLNSDWQLQISQVSSLTSFFNFVCQFSIKVCRAKCSLGWVLLIIHFTYVVVCVRVHVWYLVPLGVTPQDVIILNVVAGSVVVHFVIAYSTNYNLLADTFQTGTFHGIPVLAVSNSENCTAFVPDGLTTMFPPTLDFTISGFSSPSILYLAVKAPLVESRSALNFSMGSCLPLSVIKSNGFCHDSYQVTFNWTQAISNDCITSLAFTNGNFREIVVFLGATYTETFVDNKRVANNKRIGTVDRHTTELLAFRVVVPLVVSVTSDNQTLIPPPTLVVRAMVLSRSFDPQSYTARLVVRTKIDKPGLLYLPRVANLQQGVHSLISLNAEQSNMTCPNASVDCVQLWDVAISTNSSTCKIEDVLTITWNTTCHYPCWESGEPHFLFFPFL